MRCDGTGPVDVWVVRPRSACVSASSNKHYKWQFQSVIQDQKAFREHQFPNGPERAAARKRPLIR